MTDPMLSMDPEYLLDELTASRRKCDTMAAQLKAEHRRYVARGQEIAMLTQEIAGLRSMLHKAGVLRGTIVGAFDLSRIEAQE